MKSTFEIKLSEVRVLLSLFMVSDPWPLTNGSHEIMKEMLDRIAVEHGYNSWVEMYHKKG